jgi:hypothetical protein
MSLSHRLGRIVTALGVAFTLSGAVHAQWLRHPDPRTPRLPDGKPNLAAPAPKAPDGKPDLSGIWNNPNGKFLTNLPQTAGVQVPFQPWAAALFKERQDNFGKDRPAGFCLPHSIPNAMLVPLYPWKIVQTPNLILILYENFTQYRQVHLDGRPFPVDPKPAWFGYSVGRWEGDELVVDTQGFNDRSWLDDAGHPHTEAMRTTERFRRTSFGRMEIQFTIDDAKAYTKPWSVTVPFEILPDTEIIENICENEKDVPHLVGK